MLQKRQFTSASGPCLKYNKRDSIDTSFDLSAWSIVVRPCDLKAFSLVNKTSVGICRRDCVKVNIFSGPKYGRVERRKMDATAKSIVRARFTEDGVGCIGLPAMVGAARTDL